LFAEKISIRRRIHNCENEDSIGVFENKGRYADKIFVIPSPTGERTTINLSLCGRGIFLVGVFQRLAEIQVLLCFLIVSPHLYFPDVIIICVAFFINDFDGLPQ
jgi:hypothetical protein